MVLNRYNLVKFDTLGHLNIHDKYQCYYNDGEITLLPYDLYKFTVNVYLALADSKSNYFVIKDFLSILYIEFIHPKIRIQKETFQDQPTIISNKRRGYHK